MRGGVVGWSGGVVETGVPSLPGGHMVRGAAAVTVARKTGSPS